MSRLVGIRLGIALCCGLLVAACAVSTQLSDGNYSYLPTQDNAVRESLSIQQPKKPINVRYKQVTKCDYLENTELFAQQEKNNTFDVSVSAVKGRLLITADDGAGDTDSALIELSGRIVNFNADGHDNRINNTERHTALNADKHIAELKKYGEDHVNPLVGSNPNVINPLSLYFPEYISQIYKAGETVANIRSGDGNIWATFVFRGIATYKDKEAFVFDIMRQFPGAAAPAIFGVSIVDASTTMPLFVAYNAGSRRRLIQKTCKMS